MGAKWWQFMTKEEINVVAITGHRANAGLRIVRPRDLWHWLVDHDVPEWK